MYLVEDYNKMEILFAGSFVSCQRFINGYLRKRGLHDLYDTSLRVVKDETEQN